MTRLCGNKHGFTVVKFVLVMVALTIFVSVTMSTVHQRRAAMLKEEKAKNWRVLHEALYSAGGRNHRGEYWMPLSKTPGQLAPAPTPEFLKFLQDRNRDQTLFISPPHPDAKQMRKEALANPASAFTDDSYWYLGYVITNEKAGLAFVNTDKKAIEETGKPPTEDHISVRSHYTNFRCHRDALGMTDRLKRLETGGCLYTPPPTTPFPVVIERPGLQPGGGRVIFSDGHVEFMEYPGKWPMTEKFITALESLDSL